MKSQCAKGEEIGMAKKDAERRGEEGRERRERGESGKNGRGL